MSPEVLTVAPNTSLTEAVQIMLSAERKWMIVVDGSGKPVGLLDRQALLRAVAGNGGVHEESDTAGIER
jgi:predicted transcriptional regulator